MYVSVCVCFVCVRACVYIQTDTYMYIDMYIYGCACVSIVCMHCAWGCGPAHACVCVHMRACMYNLLIQTKVERLHYLQTRKDEKPFFESHTLVCLLHLCGSNLLSLINSSSRKIHCSTIILEFSGVCWKYRLYCAFY